MKLFQPVFNSINFKVNIFNFAAPAPSTPEKLNSFFVLLRVGFKIQQRSFFRRRPAVQLFGPKLILSWCFQN